MSGVADLVGQPLHSMFVGAVEVFSVRQQIRPVSGVLLVKSGGSVVAPRLGALGLPPSVDSPPLVDGATDASQGVHDDVHRLHACEQARLPHSDSSGQLWDGSAACGCPRQQDEIRQGKRVRTCIRCGCGCGRCAHATVVQQLECTLAMRQHSRPVNSRARSSVGVGQLVRGGVSKGRPVGAKGRPVSAIAAGVVGTIAVAVGVVGVGFGGSFSRESV